MPNLPAPKGKTSLAKPPSTSPLVTRSASTAAGAPPPPGDPTPPVKFALASSKAAAKSFLIGQSMIDKDKKAPITASSITLVLSQIVAHPDIPEIIAQLVHATNLILPEAFEQISKHTESLAELHVKLDELALAQTTPDEPPADQPDRLSALEAKLDSLCEVVNKSQASAGAAESAAIETQRTLVAFHEDAAWETAPARGAQRRQSLPAHPPDVPPRPNPPRGPSAKQQLATAQRLKAEGCYFLVEPNSGLKDSLAKLDARALVVKAELAFEAAWKVLSKTDFAQEPGKGAKPNLRFVTATRLLRGGIRYQMGDRTQAAYLSDARVSQEFEKGFGNVTCKGQGAPLLLQCAPVSWTPEAPASLRELERENLLHVGDILSAAWVKPASKRKPDQEVAVVKLELRSQEVADRLITEGGQLMCSRVTFSKMREEPVRCLRCQQFGHMVKKCRGLGDICSQCGGPHRSAQCEQPDKKYCVSCKTEAHCSYDRNCPVYREKRDALNTRKPESRSRLFNTADDGHAHLPSHRPIYFPPPPTIGDVIHPAALPSQAEAFRAFARSPNSQERDDWNKYRNQIRRKPRDGSQSWDTAEVITAPRSPSTPPRDQATQRASRSPPPAPSRSGSLLDHPAIVGNGPSFSAAALHNLCLFGRLLELQLMPYTPECITQGEKLLIWQLNVNKSIEAQTAFAHDPEVRKASILAIQEPFLDHLGSSRPPPGWRPLYPTRHATKDAPRSRSFMAINPTLSTNGWEQLDCPSPDITAVRIRTATETVVVINVYNPCEANSSLPHVQTLLGRLTSGDQVVLLGDFNRHHPQWDEERNSHPFTTAALDLAQPLLDLVGDHLLRMALPEGLPTLQSTSSKNYTRPDNVFVSPLLHDRLLRCDTAPEARPPCTDHLPICCGFDTSIFLAPSVERRNFSKTDWDTYRQTLRDKLGPLPGRRIVSSQEALDDRVEKIREAIVAAVESSTPMVKLGPRSKRWWSKELGEHRSVVRNLAARSYRARKEADHPIHEEFRVRRNQYTQAIRDAKRAHWEQFLENLDEETMWTAANYLKGEHTDGGRTRVPNLRFRQEDGAPAEACDNASKSRVLLEAFFPPPPSGSSIHPPATNTPTPVPDLPELQTRDIARAILAMKPNKAPGPDGLPACVYIQGVDLLLDHLLPVFRASLRLGIYPTAWKVSRTAVLRKPGKPDYGIAKAYRPIALLNVISKVLSSCVAERLNRLAEEHRWIPAHHFGGRPGRTCSDALHLLTKTVKDAWARGQVASALFLDVKGAFPHAHPTQLARNMKALGVPAVYITWMLTKLEGRYTSLSFDDFTSDPMPILNGIDQGCPLSVIFYLIYNSPLVSVPVTANGELCIAYIDDITFVAVGKTFADTHAILCNMMERPGGALDWSAQHNSTFELDKTGCVDFSLKKSHERPALTIGEQVITPTASHTLLGIIIDQELRWKEQCNKALAKGLLWSSQLSRLARMSYGAPPAVARRLYLSIAVPRFTYAADVWFSPVQLNTSPGKRSTGSVGFAKRLARIQSTAARAILGALKSTPIESLDIHANLLPVHLLLNEACQRAAIRLASCPDDHPLHLAVRRASKGRKAHITPLQRILQFADCRPSDFEKWPLNQRPRVEASRGDFPTRARAIMDTNTDDSHLKVFSDGASAREGVAAAAVLFSFGHPPVAASLRLGEAGNHSILDAELAGILLATHLIITADIVDDATIFTDSQEAIACIEGRALGATQVLLKAVRRALKRARGRAGSTDVRLKWCPGHAGIAGNVAADAEAKAAMHGKTYPTSSIPSSLLNYRPPTNPTTLKRKVQRENRNAASAHWLASKTGTKFSARFPGISAGDFLAHVHGLPRSRATFLFRLTSGHIQLRQHLHRLQVEDSPCCTHCGDTTETVAHYLLHCPRYALERRTLLESRGHEFVRLDFLLFSSEALGPLFDFVKATGRFTDLLR